MTYYNYNPYRNIDAPRPSLRNGIKSLFSVPSRNRYKRFLENGDSDLLLNAWANVGESIMNAMDKYSKEYGEKRP